MAWVTHGWNTPLKLIPHQTDLNCFKAVKTRQPTSCIACKSKLPKGSWIYGSDWTRICLKCGDEFSHTAIKGFQEVIDYIKLHQERLEKNKSRWNAENTLAKL